VSHILLVWLITWRSAWPLVLIALLLPLAVWVGRRKGHSLPPVRAFLAQIVVPLLLVIWCGAFYRAEPGDVMSWRTWGMLAMALSGLIILIATPVYYRRGPRTWTLVAASLVNLVFLLLVMFVGSMALVDDWL